MRRLANCLRSLFASLALSAFASGLVAPASAQESYELVVDIADAGQGAGDLVALVFDKEAGFPFDATKALKTAKTKLSKPRVVFKELPGGEYVVVVFHDRNSNGKLDRSPIGFPTEPVGVSTNPSVPPPPSFDKVKVDIRETDNITIKMKKLGR